MAKLGAFIVRMVSSFFQLFFRRERSQHMKVIQFPNKTKVVKPPLSWPLYPVFRLLTWGRKLICNHRWTEHKKTYSSGCLIFYQGCKKCGTHRPTYW